MTDAIISVKRAGQWVDIRTLPEQEQIKIKQRVAERWRESTLQQIAVMMAGDNEVNVAKTA